MSNYVQERYKPFQVPANATTICPASGIGGFLAITAGTIQISTNRIPALVIIPPLTVVAGTYYPLPFSASVDGMVITTAGGASGVLAVA